MRSAAALLLLTAAATFLSLLLLGAASTYRTPLASPTGGGGGMAGEAKVRLGSSPPSCHNKCYECSPCVAVQVPTLSGPTARVRSRPTDASEAAAAREDVSPVTFSNYKPLGWKCQCRDRLYDP